MRNRSVATHSSSASRLETVPSRNILAAADAEVVAATAGAAGHDIRRPSIVRLTKDSTPCNFAMTLQGGAVRRR